MRTEAEKLRYVRIDILEKIKANNYVSYDKEKRYDPELVDREIRRKKKRNEARLEKYKKLMEERNVPI